MSLLSVQWSRTILGRQQDRRKPKQESSSLSLSCKATNYQLSERKPQQGSYFVCYFVHSLWFSPLEKWELMRVEESSAVNYDLFWGKEEKEQSWCYRLPWSVATSHMGIETVAMSQGRETVTLGQSPVEHQPSQWNGKVVIWETGLPKEGCLASAGIRQSHEDPLNQRMQQNKEIFLSR